MNKEPQLIGQILDNWFSELEQLRERVAYLEKQLNAKPDKVLTRTEAAAFLGMSPSNLDKLRRAGQIECVRVNEKGHSRYRQSDLEKYLSRF